MNALHRACILSVLLALAACATVPTDPAARADYDQADDPAEPANREVFRANQFLDRNTLKPTATAYQNHVPNGVRRSIRNFVSNLGEPRVLLNDLLQGNMRRAWNTTQRFVINSTVGGAGFFDVASPWGLPHHNADFGQTFGVWGIGPGPAVQLPLLGPSNLRDTMGGVLGFVVSPFGRLTGSTLNPITTAGNIGGAVDGRSQTLQASNSLEKTSLDYYATLRSINAQRRAAFVQDGKEGHVQSELEGVAVTGSPGADASPAPITP